MMPRDETPVCIPRTQRGVLQKIQVLARSTARMERRTECAALLLVALAAAPAASLNMNAAAAPTASWNMNAGAMPSAPLRLRGGLIAGVERCTSNEDAVKVRQGAACSRS